MKCKKESWCRDLQKKNVEKTSINAKAGRPRPKKYRAFAELLTDKLLKEP